VGGVYAANTVGAIVGSVMASLVLVYWFGSQRAQQVLMIVSGVSGLLLLAPAELGAPSGKKVLRWMAPAALVIALGLAAFLIRTVPTIPGILVAYGRYAATWLGQEGDIFYVGEGLSSSVAVSRFAGVMNYHNAGKVQASSQPQDMRLQRMLGHFTTLVPKSPKKVLVIGCGAGATAGAVSIDQNVETLIIAEIEPLVPRVVSEHFGEHNFNVVRNPKTQVVIDDARHYLLTTHERFDAITSDPLDPWVKGAATLYTREFFELAKSKLNPGGTVTLFVQLYESTPEAVKSEIATFFDVFPHGIIWGNTHQGRGYDTVLMGTVDPPHFDVDEWEARLNTPQYAAIKASLGEISIYSAVDLFGNYAGRASDLKTYLQDAQINHDRDLRLQYLAGLGLNLYQSGPIYAEILRHKKYPDGLFSGSPETMERLRAAIASAPGADPQ
jgi:spermidine synthase